MVFEDRVEQMRKTMAVVLLALLDRITSKKFPEQLIRAFLALFAVLVYPVFYTVLGFMAIGMAHD